MSAVVAVSGGLVLTSCADPGTSVRSEGDPSADVPPPVEPDPLANQYPFIEEPTFEYEEITLASFNVVAPTHLPDAFRLLEAGYLSSDQRELQEGDCGKVVLFYADPAKVAEYDGTGVHPPYLQLDLVDTDCTTDDARDAEARAEKGAGSAVPIELGGSRASIARFDGPSTGPGFIVQLEVDGTDVFVDSTLSRHELLLALTALKTFDPATQPTFPTTTR